MPLFFVAKPLLGAVLVCTIIAGTLSCGGPTPRERQQARLLERLDSNLKKQSDFMLFQTNMVRRALEDRLNDFHQSEKAKRWQPIVEQIHIYTQTAIQNIGQMLFTLKQKPDNRLFDIASGDSVFRILLRYKYHVLNTDEYILKEFSPTIMEGIPVTNQPTEGDTKSFVKNTFSQLSNGEVITVLHYWENEIRLTENKLITFCFHQSTTNFCGIDMISLLIGQSHGSVAPGETLLISAGVGSYSTKASPKIKFNGIPVITENGVAQYKIKAPTRKGTYTIPVQITYIDPNGNHVTETKTIAYTVR
jgi:hypothetical protein